MSPTRCILILMLVLLTGCASVGASRDPRDPFESFNRSMSSLNDNIDKVAFKRTAIFYKEVVPSFVRTGVSNFFGNLGDVWTAANGFLQGKPGDGLSDVLRVAVNSTFGFLGVLDIASEAGLVKHNEDFGQTLGVWGVPSGPYVVLPILGSSTVRDTAGYTVDFSVDPWGHVTPVSSRNAGTVVRAIDKRASLLDVASMVEDAALDKYIFTRDAYLQRRQSLIKGGNQDDDN